MIGFNPIIRVTDLHVVDLGQQFVQDPWVGGGPVGGHLRGRPCRSARVKNLRAAARSRFWEAITSMTWPVMHCAAETARDLITGSRLVVIDSGHLPHTTSPAAVAAELAWLANSAFGDDRRTHDADNRPPATGEEQP